MSQKRFSQAYIQHLTNGPFPNRIDMWAEEAFYFHQIHATMISSLIQQMREDLLVRGYVAGRELSIQTVIKPEPAIPINSGWNYADAATAIGIEPGIEADDENPEVDAIMIRSQDGELVTVLEIISPFTKSYLQHIDAYIQKRNENYLKQGIHVLEIDCTRSIYRLLVHEIIVEHPYHIVIYLSGDYPRVLVSDWLEPLRPFALPLRNDAIRVETQDAYDRAYHTMGIANQIHNKRQYIIDALPFPSTLTDAQKESALQAVQQWQARLEQLREEK